MSELNSKTSSSNMSLAAAVPRYTSYPTAPHFSADVDAKTYAGWLQSLPEGEAISLYIHIPFCDRLCWFCACTTKQTRRYEPVRRYLTSLYSEIDTVARHIPAGRKVTALHLGGGSPTMLKPADLVALNERLRKRFQFADDAEISVEIDPNDMDEERHEALSAIGMTRASLGVQDFDERVQKAINREQSFAQTADVVTAARAGGAKSVNIDLLYGLPHQTLASIAATVRQVLQLTPDRIALFGYAHVPWMKKHQTMIDEASLPDTTARFEQSEHAADLLLQAGYQQIGIDHFAKPDDSMAHAATSGHLRRNFQGYTTDEAKVTIGLGTSAIGKLPQGYIQNMPASGGYQRMVNASGLATVRGYALRDGDRVRSRAIEALMCDFALSIDDLKAEFGAAAEPVAAEAEQLATNDTEGLFERRGDTFAITAKGRPFTRIIASNFDEFLGTGQARHSSAV